MNVQIQIHDSWSSSYLVSAEDAIKLMKIFENAIRLESQWVGSEMYLVSDNKPIEVTIKSLTKDAITKEELDWVREQEKKEIE